MTTIDKAFANSDSLTRAQGCLLGQLAGDALGSLVEFESPDQIRRQYPDGVRDLADGRAWNTIAGQPTDDSELALSLARVLVRVGRYDREEAREAYVSWLDSEPFDCGATIDSGLRGYPNPDSQANGAMMRISPLGIFGARHALSDVAEWAQQDAELTHPNPVCPTGERFVRHGNCRCDPFSAQCFPPTVTASSCFICRTLSPTSVTAPKRRKIWRNGSWIMKKSLSFGIRRHRTA